MDPYSSQNFKIKSPHLGNIYFNPKEKIPKEISEASLILCPRPLSKIEREALVEWAAASQALIFLLPSDLEHMVGEGFGAHRFHKLDSYKEVDFQGGSITFYPVRKEIRRGFAAFWGEIKGLIGVVEESSFHVLLKPKEAESILVLSEPWMDPIDWELLAKFKPTSVIALSGQSLGLWNVLEKRLGIKILVEEEMQARGGGNVLFAPHSELHQKAPSSSTNAEEKTSDLIG